MKNTIALLQSLSKMSKDGTTSTTPFRLGKNCNQIILNKNTTETIYSFVSQMQNVLEREQF
jgi:hypothetical protein